MRPTLLKHTLAASAVLAGLAWSGGRPARAQNTYADVPFNQGSLFYRPSGSKPPAVSGSPGAANRGAGLFRRRRGPAYAAPARAYATAPAPAYAPQAVVPTARYYYYPQR